jgi:hypothetical protein
MGEIGVSGGGVLATTISKTIAALPEEVTTLEKQQTLGSWIFSTEHSTNRTKPWI